MEQEIELTQIGKYRILNELGKGSMGVVYKALDPEIGRTVAIKTLRKLEASRSGGPEEALEQFRNEARSAGKLRHPSIITIFDVNRDGDLPFIVMDYVEGESLRAILDREFALPPGLAITILAQVAAAIDYAHSKGVVHRDIKPSNIIVDRYSNAFILDFGVASINKSYSEWDGPVDTPVVGTPSYMSPEQILNQNLDGRTDLFSLAVVAFECFTGRRPFAGDTFAAVVASIVNGEPLALTQLMPALPLALEADFDRALERDREQRFLSAHEMIRTFARSVGIEVPGALSLGIAGQYIGGGVVRAPEIPAASGAEKAPADDALLPALRTPVRFGGAAGASASGSRSPGEMFNTKDDPLAARHADDGNQDRGFRAALIAVLLLGFFFAALLISYSVEEKTPRVDPVPVDEGTGPVVTERRSEPPAENQDNPLVEPATDAVPLGKDVFTMSDKQLLGVLKSSTVPERMTIDALKEAQRRNIPGVVDISIYPLQSDSYIVRVETIKTLAEIGDRRIVPQLLLRLDDHDPLVRGHAAKALGILGDRRALGYLTSRMLSEDSPDVKQVMARAIDKINGLSRQNDN